MKYNCICKKEYRPDHLYVNGGIQLNSGKYAGKTTYVTPVGSSFNFTVKPNDYTLTSLDGVFKIEMTRDCFREYFTIKSFMRNRKLEELGI